VTGLTDAPAYPFEPGRIRYEIVASALSDCSELRMLRVPAASVCADRLMVCVPMPDV
jgi:hypothetical protein